MNREAFWHLIEGQSRDPIEPIYKELLNQRQFHSLMAFIHLDDGDITELCQDMQRHIKKVQIGSRDYNELVQLNACFRNDYELSLAFKSTVKHVRHVCNQLIDQRNSFF